MLEIAFDNGVVRLSAVKKAAYHLSARVSAEVSVTGNTIVCKLTQTPGSDATDTELEQVFRAVAMDYELREHIGEDTRQIRNAILAAAFAPLTSKLQG
jgi:His-Xaa-Ser system protein HxsD